MRVIISLPLPFDAWSTYRPMVKRFCDTFKQFPPGHECEVWAVCNWGEPADEVREWFRGIKTRFVLYYENGCDLGGHQLVSQACGDEAFIVGMTTRCYFHREGWLSPLMKARKEYGPGLYGCSASAQGGRLHLCTRAFGMDASIWREYPHVIDSRSKGPFFEVGTDNPDGNLLEWITKPTKRNQIYRAFICHWDESFELPFAVDKYFSSQGRFRDGDQNAMLVHDYHTEQFKNADVDERLRLARMMMDGEKWEP